MTTSFQRLLAAASGLQPGDDGASEEFMLPFQVIYETRAGKTRAGTTSGGIFAVLVPNLDKARLIAAQLAQRDCGNIVISLTETDEVIERP